MSTAFTLTPQPIRLTAADRQPIYLSLDASAFDSLDVEAVCAVEGTATNAALNLFTGMQTSTDDGWLIPMSNFAPISGTGPQVTQVTLGAGLLQHIRWDVSSLGGASALSFFIRGIGRTRAGGAVLAKPGGGLRATTGVALDPMQLGYSQVESASVNGVGSGGANFTVGVQVAFNRPSTITGIRIYWGGFSTTTVKCQIWDPSFASLVTVNIPVTTAAGIYTGTLPTPISIAAVNCFKPYQLSTYEASHYTYAPTAPTRPGSIGNALGGGSGAYSDASYETKGGFITVLSESQYVVGDARPNINLSVINQYYPIEPIITAP